MARFVKDLTRPIAWAALCVQGNPRAFLHEGAIRSLRREVQKYIGEAWAQIGETSQTGWRRAYRAGWRAVRVRVYLLKAEERK